MAKYTLTTDEKRVLTSWLYEPNGYLDSAVNSSGVSARQALSANSSLNVTEWIRSNIKHSNTIQSNWDECSMCWWLLVSDNVNITQQTKPAEYNTWKAILLRWKNEIDLAFTVVPKTQRDLINMNVYSAGGIITTMSNGSHFANQQSIQTKTSAL